MTSERVRDYLEKQLFIENTVVTYRLLSRELGIHVNDARLELQKFRSARRDVHATYIMIGTPPSRYGFDSDPFAEIDEEAARRWEENTGGEAVQERLMLLVSEDELEDSKSQFYIIDSIDVYSVSAVYLIDADLVCKEQDRIRELDAQDKTGELAKKVGRIIGRNVKKRKPVKRDLKAKGKLGAASTTLSTIKKGPSVKKDATVRKGSTLKAEPTKTGEEVPEKPKAPIEKKPTKAGQLDWSKAKSKVEKEKEKADELKARAEKEAREAKAKREKDREDKEKENAKIEGESAETLKRGVKRKTGVLDVSDSEQSEKPPSPEPPKGARLKGRTIVSDDEESDEPKPRKGKVSAQSSDIEELGRSVLAMMDIDDDEVEKATVAARTKPLPKSKSKAKLVESSDEEEQAEPGDAEDSMYVDDEPAEVKRRKPRKKTEKKAVPVGRNGLKKKRVVKSRMSTDAKGYMVTEDYSSYESVDEEEPEEQEKPKKKLAPKPSESKLKRKASSKETKAPSKELKKRASTGGGSSSKVTAGQSNLMNFFGKRP